MTAWESFAGDIPLAQIVEALDDNRDGEADLNVWADVRRGASDRIADCFGGPPPARFAQACAYAERVFILETLYVRRGFYGSQNPYAGKADDAEKRLRRLAAGEDAVEAPANIEGHAETEPLRSVPSRGVLA